MTQRLLRIWRPGPRSAPGRLTIASALFFAAFTLSTLAAPRAQAQATGGPTTTDAEIVADLNLDLPGMAKVKADVKVGNMAAAQAAYLEYRRTASPAKWKTMPSEMPANAAATDNPIGDEIIRHHIRNTFYGFFPHEGDMGSDFDWTHNPVDRNSQKFSDEWTYCVISRTQFWEQLGDAYWKTRDEKYAKEWVAELEDFAVKNPRTAVVLKDRPSLWRTLDSAIRMSESWPYAYYHFLNSPSFTPEAQWTYLKEMRDHAILLENGLKNPQRTGNWVTTETFGLYTIALLFPEFKESARWREICVSRISTELARMVPPDGFEIELTPNYHMVALEGFRGPLLLAKLNHVALPEPLLSKIMSMYRALVNVMEQNGDVVSTNDSSPYNAVKTSRQGLELADDPLLAWAASGGKEGIGLPDSTRLPYAGFYTMRSGWQPDDMFLFFRAGPTGSGHEHEDMLQVVLKCGNKTLLLEPGSSLYDHSDWRRFIIGTEAHNTIVIDGKWQHRGPSKAPVETPANNPWVTTPLFDFVSGTYDGGYQKSVYDQKKEYQPQDWVGEVDRSVSHTRRVLYLRPYYALLLDTIDGTGTHTIDSHFDVASPSVRVDPATQAAFSQNKTDEPQIALYPLDRENLKVDVIQGEHGAPDIKWDVPTVQFRKQQGAPALFATFLYPYQGAAPHFTSDALTMGGSDAWGQRLHTDKEDAEVAMAKSGKSAEMTFSSLFDGDVSATAAGLTLRRLLGKQDVLIGGWAMTALKTGRLELLTDVPSVLLVRQHDGVVTLYNGGDRPVHITVKRPVRHELTLGPSSAATVDAAAGPVQSDASVFRLEK